MDDIDLGAHRRALLQYALDCGEQVIIACESAAAAVYTQLAYDGLVVCAGYVQAAGVDCLCFELTDAGRLALEAARP